MTEASVAVAPQAAPDGSPLWWLRRLHQRIADRRPVLRRLQRYYDGEFSLMYADEKLREAFGNVFYAQRFGINWMRLVVEAVEERLQVEGVRIGGNPQNNPKAWEIWQAANLDELSSTAHTEALINGVCYLTVWPSEEPEYPEITIEHPAQAYVELDPKTPSRRLAGIRMWVDLGGYLRAELFLPDTVHLYRSRDSIDARWNPGSMYWDADTSLSEDGSIRNPYGVVPMVPMQNVPRLLRTSWDWIDLGKCSEIWSVLPVQDAINSVVFNAILVGNAQGYRQRWVTGLDIEYDDQGNPKRPFKPGLDRLLQASSPDTRFGEFSTTDVTPLIKLCDMLIGSIASISKTPPHYFNPSADRLSGESIKAVEAGLIAKVRRKQVAFGGAWAEVLRIAGLIVEDTGLSEARAAEMIWRNPETRTEAQMADAAVKLTQIGVPWRKVMEYLMFSPQEIDQMQTERAHDQLMQTLQAARASEMVWRGAEAAGRTMPGRPPETAGGGTGIPGPAVPGATSVSGGPGGQAGAVTG